MQSAIRWATVIALAWTTAGCAYGVVDEPTEEEGEGSEPTRLMGSSLGDGLGSGTTTGPSGGGCYAEQGECNPMTQGCGDDEACDATESQGFACFPTPSAVEVGGVCDMAGGTNCASGSTCVEGTCRAYCCTVGDCAFGTCRDVDFAGGIALRACLP